MHPTKCIACLALGIAAHAYGSSTGRDAPIMRKAQSKDFASMAIDVDGTVREERPRQQLKDANLAESSDTNEPHASESAGQKQSQKHDNSAMADDYSIDGELGDEDESLDIEDEDEDKAQSKTAPAAAGNEKDPPEQKKGEKLPPVWDKIKKDAPKVWKEVEDGSKKLADSAASAKATGNDKSLVSAMNSSLKDVQKMAKKASAETSAVAKAEVHKLESETGKEVAKDVIGTLKQADDLKSGLKKHTVSPDQAIDQMATNEVLASTKHAQKEDKAVKEEAKVVDKVAKAESARVEAAAATDEKALD